MMSRGRPVANLVRGLSARPLSLLFPEEPFVEAPRTFYYFITDVRSLLFPEEPFVEA